MEDKESVLSLTGITVNVEVMLDIFLRGYFCQVAVFNMFQHLNLLLLARLQSKNYPKMPPLGYTIQCVIPENIHTPTT